MKKRILIISAMLLLALLNVSTVFAADVGSVEGGGQIIEASNGAKRPEWSVISFGGWVQSDGATITGEWEVNFHNVDENYSEFSLDQSKFHSTNIIDFNTYPSNDETCEAAFNMTLLGTLNGETGYRMIFRAGDDGSPGFADTIRITLYEGTILVYDTHVSEFPDESDCQGTARTGLDAGNITITR